jgi:hypothetical protein
MNEAVRAITAWCADATEGVNARRGVLPRDLHDPAPPALVAILDDTRSQIVSRRRVTKDLEVPALLVFDRGTRWPGGVQAGIRRGSTEVGLVLLVKDADTAAATETLNYLARLVRRTLDALSIADAVTWRTRNSILLEDFDGVEEVAAQPWFDSAQLVLELRATWKVRDLAP